MQLGVKMLGVLIGLIIITCFNGDMLGGSLMALLATVFHGYYTATGMLQEWLGSTSMVQLVFCGGICLALRESGAMNVIAKKLLTSKMCKGRPVMLMTMLFFAAYAVSAFVGGPPTYILFFGIIESIRDVCGYKNDDPFIKWALLGAYISATGSFFFAFKSPQVMTIAMINTAMEPCWRIGGYDLPGLYEYFQANPGSEDEFKATIAKITGFRSFPIWEERDDVNWMNNWHPGKDVTVIKDQTQTEIETRLTIRPVIDYLRTLPPLKNAFLYDIAPQLGTRCSRRLTGEYMMTANDFAFPRHHEDVVAWSTTICSINDNAPVEIPYGAILAQKIDGLLAPGRHLSADNVAIDWVNLIPQCVQTGQAAGVAAAVAVLDGTNTHGVNIAKVQDILVDQDVPLPVEKFNKNDPSYMELVEGHEYGLYTDLAKKIRAEAGGDTMKKYRQW